jgi:hypothetical protein
MKQKTQTQGEIDRERNFVAQMQATYDALSLAGDKSYDRKFDPSQEEREYREYLGKVGV